MNFLKNWLRRFRESWKEFLRLMADPNFLNAMTSADWLLGTKSEAEDEPSE